MVFGSQFTIQISSARSPTFSAANAIGPLVNVVFYGLIFVFSLYFQRQRGYSAIGTRLAFVPTTTAVMAANLPGGRGAAGFGPRSSAPASG